MGRGRGTGVVRGDDLEELNGEWTEQMLDASHRILAELAKLLNDSVVAL